MNYQRIYNQLMERGKNRALNCYSEWHHILPRSLGGSDEDSNLVELTYREHFLAHWVLTKIYNDGHGRRAMLYAFQCMGTLGSGQRIMTGWQYNLAKKVCSDGLFDLAPDQNNRSFDKVIAKKMKKIRDVKNQRKANKLLANDPNGCVIFKGRHYRLKSLH